MIMENGTPTKAVHIIFTSQVTYLNMQPDLTEKEYHEPEEEWNLNGKNEKPKPKEN